MSPPRKRPMCQACGTPMAGHKRPHGQPVCPELPPTPISARRRPLRRNNAVSDIEIPPTGTWHRRNPNWVDREVTPEPDDDQESHSSWVPTEPADGDGGSDVIGDEDVEKPFGDEEDRHSDAGTSRPSVSSVRRTLSQALRNSLPLASLFSTPTAEISMLADAARRDGLAMGLLHRPGSRIKSEDEDAVHEVNVGRQNSWWVVMGRDRKAVSHLLDLNERQENHQRDEGSHPLANKVVGAYPLDPRSIRMTFLDVIIAGAIGGLVVFYALSVM